MGTVVVGAGLIGTAIAHDPARPRLHGDAHGRRHPRGRHGRGGGAGRTPRRRRAKVTVRRAQQALPGLVGADFTEWMGHRPALPDTVPILSAGARMKGLFYATGHGHLGPTYAATTARLMEERITGARPARDLHPCRVNRF
jgi:D-amino-acid dehydrogenase